MSELILYSSDDGQTRLHLRVDGETAWLSQLEIAELFQTSKQNVSLHAKNIFADGELSRGSAVKESLTTATDGKKYRTQLYNLDLILAIGYRVRSPRGVQFRQWATAHLKEFLQKGFVMDEERLKNPGGWDFFDELLAKIREIRASEKRFYQKVRELFALSSDYRVEALVCLANTEGGELWLGVEDDGTPTGLHETHQNLAGLPGLVAARTSPSLNVTVEAVALAGVRVARIVVDQSTSEVATTAGKYLRRRLKPDGSPECVALLPHERSSRASRFGLVDASAQAVAGASLADLDPLERERLRQTVEQYGGDRVLLELPTVPADLTFRRMVVDIESQRGAELPIDSLIALAALREFKRLSAEDLARHIQRDTGSAKRTLEALTEAGLVEAHGNTRGRSYTLSASVYSVVSDKAAYTRQKGFGPIQHEQMVLSYIRQHGQIKRAEIMDLCRLTEGQVKRLLQRMLAAGQIARHGQSTATAYTEPKETP
ncbi:MAG: RhuM family protein [Rhodocyclaceae bacterium]|nr:RhuM family protein [Rhodocyclaceae bacterium]